MDYQELAWDTEFFGFKTGRIIPVSLSQKELNNILTEMSFEEYRLVYWSVDRLPAYHVHPYSRNLVDKKTT